MNHTEYLRLERNGIIHYRAKSFENLGFVRHGFSTRHGGVSALPQNALNLSYAAWDSGDCVDENRRRFLGNLGIEPSSLITLSQIHSDRVHIIEENPEQWNRRTQGDALITSRENIALAVQAADCLPVLMADPSTRTIAAVHAGWRGLSARIIAKTIRRMRDVTGSDAEEWLVAIGPGIRSCCFEVAREVMEAFEAAFPSVPLSRPAGPSEKFLLDLPAALHAQLAECGILREKVAELELCTRCNTREFFSYRGEGPKSGRMMGVISLASA